MAFGWIGGLSRKWKVTSSLVKLPNKVLTTVLLFVVRGWTGKCTTCLELAMSYLTLSWIYLVSNTRNLFKLESVDVIAQVKC